MLITIRRLERVVDGSTEVLEEQHFDMWAHAIAYLEQRLKLQFTPDQLDEIMAHKETQTNPRLELINHGAAAYTAPVLYEIEVD